MAENHTGSQLGQEVEDASRFAVNEERLTDWLGKADFGFKGPIQELVKFSTGESNPTFRIRAASGIYVIRSKPRGRLVKSAHQIEREYAVFESLYGTPVPVPRPLAYCHDVHVLGAEFYVMEFVEGRIFRDIRLPDVEPADRRRIYEAAVDTLVHIHRVDVAAHPRLKALARPAAFYPRQVKTLRRVAAAQTGAGVPSLPHADGFLAWAELNLPSDERTLVHGDFKLDNLVFHPTEPRVVAVLDWELTTIGHPLSDVANMCMFEYLPETVPLGTLGTDRPHGIPDLNELLLRYAAHRSVPEITPREWLFAAAFASFRMGVILQGVAFRASKGQASSTRAKLVGMFARQLVGGAWVASQTSEVRAMLHEFEDETEVGHAKL